MGKSAFGLVPGSSECQLKTVQHGIKLWPSCQRRIGATIYGDEDRIFIGTPVYISLSGSKTHHPTIAVIAFAEDEAKLLMIYPFLEACKYPDPAKWIIEDFKEHKRSSFRQSSFSEDKDKNWSYPVACRELSLLQDEGGYILEMPDRYYHAILGYMMQKQEQGKLLLVSSLSRDASASWFLD